MKNNLLKMKLQMFAEENLPGDTPPAGDATPPDDEPITLTAKELQSKLDAEAEKRVAKVTSKKEAEYQELLKKAREEGKKEGMSYGQLTEKERLEKEAEEERKAFEIEKEQFQREKLTLEVSKDLRDKNLPESLADVLVLAGDKTVIANKVAELKTELDSWLAEQLKVNARQETPDETGGFTGSTNTTKSIREFANENRLIKGE